MIPAPCPCPGQGVFSCARRPPPGAGAGAARARGRDRRAAARAARRPPPAARPPRGAAFPGRRRGRTGPRAARGGIGTGAAGTGRTGRGRGRARGAAREGNGTGGAGRERRRRTGPEAGREPSGGTEVGQQHGTKTPPGAPPAPARVSSHSGSGFFPVFGFGTWLSSSKSASNGRAWCHNVAKRGRNEVVSPRVIDHATRQPIPRHTVTLRSNGATTSQNPSQTKFRHHMRVSVGCLSPALPHGDETMRGATTSPHTGKTKLCHHTFSSPALPPVSLPWLLVIVCGATTSPITAKTRLWHQRETRWDSTAPEAQPAGPPQKFSRAKTPEKRLDIVPKKAQARIAQAPLRCDASIERSDS